MDVFTRVCNTVQVLPFIQATSYHFPCFSLSSSSVSLPRHHLGGRTLDINPDMLKIRTNATLDTTPKHYVHWLYLSMCRCLFSLLCKTPWLLDFHNLCFRTAHRASGQPRACFHKLWKRLWDLYNGRRDLMGIIICENAVCHAILWIKPQKNTIMPVIQIINAQLTLGDVLF